MPFRKSPLIDSIGVGEMAQNWGKIVARRVQKQHCMQSSIASIDLRRQD